jgi:YfiH family protein
MNIQHSFKDKNTKYTLSDFTENDVIVKAMHQNNVLVVNSLKQALEIKPRAIMADSIVTNVAGINFFMTGADCPTIIFKDHSNKIAAITHCGWKPAFLGIIQNTILELKKLGSDIKDLEVFIGPGMAQQNFECREDMYNKFLEQNKENKQFFVKKSTEHYLFDLIGYCKFILNNNGINNVVDCKIDTYSNENYHSYRRYSHTLGKDFMQKFTSLEETTQIVNFKYKYLNFNSVVIKNT